MKDKLMRYLYNTLTGAIAIAVLVVALGFMGKLSELTSSIVVGVATALLFWAVGTVINH